MSRPKTVAEWRREDPAFAAMIDDVVRLRKSWPGTHSVAHRDQTTGAVTFHLHVREHDLGKLRDLLGDVPVARMQNASVTTYHFHGRRPDMDRLLKELAR
jgi:hypothetical protein